LIKKNEMKNLTADELMEINGGVNQAAYNAGHAAGDFAQEVVRGVLLLATLFLRSV
jgi:bacteriocin-like protein